MWCRAGWARLRGAGEPVLGRGGGLLWWVWRGSRAALLSAGPASAFASVAAAAWQRRGCGRCVVGRARGRDRVGRRVVRGALGERRRVRCVITWGASASSGWRRAREDLRPISALGLGACRGPHARCGVLASSSSVRPADGCGVVLWRSIAGYGDERATTRRWLVRPRPRTAPSWRRSEDRLGDLEASIRSG